MSLVKCNSLQLGQSLTASQNFTWYQPATPDGTVRLGVGNAGATTLDAVTVNNSGNVGIGTSSPGQKLVVSGSGAQRFDIIDTGGATGRVSTASGTVYVGTTTNHPLAFFTNDSVKATLDSSGNLGLGVTPSYRLDVLSGSTGAKMFRFSSVGTGTYMYGYCDGGGTGITNSDPYTNGVMYYQTGSQHQFYKGSTQAMTLDASGNLLVTQTSASYTTLGASIRANGAVSSASASDFWNAYSTAAGAYRFYVTNAGTIYATNTTIAAISDQRLKENIRDLDDGLSTILALKPRRFDWKEGKGKDIKDDRGFIAQEFEQVFPDLVDTWKDEPPEGEEPYKAVRPDLIPVMVKAIQELSAELNELKKRLN